MNSKKHIVFNGEIVPADQPVLSIENRGFRFGDTIFETIRYHKGIPLFFDDHFNRLLQGMTTFKMNLNSLPSKDKLKNQIETLVTKSRIFGDARIRLTVFRNDGGLYTPASNDVSYTIETSSVKKELFSLDKKGLLLDVYYQHRKPITQLHSFKNANSILYVLAGIFKKELLLDDCLIINENNEIIEGLSSNLFWIKNKTVYTPLLSTGCVDGIMRKQVINAVNHSDLDMQEVAGSSIDELLNADEIFLTNSIQGVRWVMGFQNQRFYNLTTKKIVQLLITNLQLLLDEESSN